MELYLNQAEIKAISNKEALEKILKEIQEDPLLACLPKLEFRMAFSKITESLATELIEHLLKKKIEKLTPKAKPGRKKKTDVVVEFDEPEAPTATPELSKALESEFDAIVSAVKKDKAEKKIDASAKKRVLIF